MRPTADRTREALFNIIFSRLGSLDGFRVLDVFAGTGAFGLEALSRGAQNVAFIDKDVKLVQKNAALLPAEKNNIKIISAVMPKLVHADQEYHLVFADAPYGHGLTEVSLASLAQKGWIADQALCLAETSRDENLSLPDAFEPVGQRQYGVAKISFYIYRK